MEHFNFLLTAMRDRYVGAFAPTSARCAREICRRIDSTRPQVVVEYGPGTGAFTRQLLKSLHPNSTLLAIEFNRDFASRLRHFDRKRAYHQPRLVVSHNDASNVLSILERHGFERADCIISGIPFSLLSDEQKIGIVENTRRALAADGQFLVYQYSFRMRGLLKKYFNDVTCRRMFSNFPPYCLMQARNRVPAALPASAL